ncbi:hypothetical protein NBH00_13900 [Paraconexibacter antarcticus]|uniref:Uncharacterized protein n=1 Tax=Paraconexibacter antarcticus TaxID=2949664 RepID=A0ABY5DM52_9ACTN|nr:hypothetical protein [Paraconexibacter antarcticus]UTI62455.1 hypothetical protein NBH00_13900 [Paraconexibacter antarcticus]
MPSALRNTPDPAPEAGAAFAVDRLAARQGTLIVEGRWSGVRGMRFLRPTLVVEGRQVLATLEHKPWAPAEGTRWTAAFPWTDGEDALATATMEVAPSVVVPLGPDAIAAAAGAPARAKRSRTSSVAPVRTVAPAAAVAPAAPERQAKAEGRPAVEAPAVAAGDAGLPGARLPEYDPAETPDPAVQTARRALRDAERERDEQARAARSAIAERDRALARVDEAVRDREAAVRTRDRISTQLEEVEAARARAEREREEGIAAARRERDERVAAAERERDERIARLERDRDERIAALEHERDEAVRARAAAQGQRDDALLARDAFRPVPGGDAVGDEAAPTRPAPVRPRQPTAVTPAVRDEDDDSPIGIRSVPAARAAGLRRREDKRSLGVFDVWALRVLATATATCFLILLFSLVRLFL